MSKLGIVLSYKNCCILKHALRDKIQEKEEWLKANSDGNENHEEDRKEFEEEKRALAAITEEINWRMNRHGFSFKPNNKKL